MTDVAVFLLPSFQGPGDDHQRALLHAVSESAPPSHAHCHEHSTVAFTGARLQVVHAACTAVDVTSTHLSLNDKSRWRQASAAASVLHQRRARVQLPQAPAPRTALPLSLQPLLNIFSHCALRSSPVISTLRRRRRRCSRCATSWSTCGPCPFLQIRVVQRLRAARRRAPPERTRGVANAV